MPQIEISKCVKSKMDEWKKKEGNKSYDSVIRSLIARCGIKIPPPDVADIALTKALSIIAKECAENNVGWINTNIIRLLILRGHGIIISNTEIEEKVKLMGHHVRDIPIEILEVK